eukprot:TRINITY_DN52206_c0_g1_i1.p1 TRINITY_DN52206_c0_g1~~TRINITY_DN52206_c0_g1_i1.p1  ORF type:complete len:462 (+),score=111.51 TRINITY_DN52206_c0_g1_i1:31-1386(+)
MAEEGELRQRRGARGGTGRGAIDPEEEKERREKQKQWEQDWALYIVGFVVFIMFAICGTLFWTHSHVDFHKAPKQKHDFDRQEVKAHMANHTILHIGGLHRSGTTLLADILSQHSDVAGLEHQPGHDARKAHWIKNVMSEGIFLQSVYPKFGLDHDKFLVRKWVGQALKKIPFLPDDAFPWMKLREGVGRFATHPKHPIDDTSHLIKPKAQEHLFNEWGLFWDLSRPVLLEKSPSNIIISPFLHRLWGLGVAASPARFLFVQRHPIPVVVATARRGGMMVNDLDTADLVENWVMAEETRAKHIEKYFDYYEYGKDVYRIIELEEVLQEPRKVLVDLLRWLKLSQSEQLLQEFEKQVRPDQNIRYFQVYCKRLVHGGKKVLDEHHRLITRFRARVLAVSRYDLATLPQICREVLLTPAEKNETERSEVETSLQAEEEAEVQIVADLESKQKS